MCGIYEGCGPSLFSKGLSHDSPSIPLSPLSSIALHE